MSSHTLLYIVVIPVTWWLFWQLKSPRARTALMLLVSYVLYASWGLRFVGLLVLSSVLNYVLGATLSRRPSATTLWAGVILNLALLGTFKYLPAIAPLLPHTPLTGRLAGIALPVGISFWTFQGLSYLFDVYQGKDVKPSFVEFLLYMAFWPTVLSGPICRLPNLLPQFRESPNPSDENVRSGLDRIGIGLVMAALGQALANGAHPGQGVDNGFDRLNLGWTGPDVWCLVIGYGFELFFDFAGYSHIVIGAARLFGIRLDENFARPYLATTPSEFWTRWHMSLSFWIRDYLFLPLAMLRRERWWRSVPLVLSMILFGLWHKGTVLLALWGLYHGVLLVLHRQWQLLRRRLGRQLSDLAIRPLSWLITFAAISLGWIWFRANSAAQALTMLRAVLTPSSYLGHVLLPTVYLAVMACVLGYFGTVAAAALYRRHHDVFRMPIELRLAWYAVAVYVGVLHTAQTRAFIYFQF